MPEPSALTLDRLLTLRETTERVAAFLGARLRDHVGTLYPILAAKRALGKYVGSRDPAPKADENYQELVERFKLVCSKPFGLRTDLEEEALGAMEHGLEVYPWEYPYQAGDKTISIACPFRWVVTYKSDYTLKEMRALLAGAGERRPNSVRHFVVNALGFSIALNRAGGVGRILNDLRYRVAAEAPAEFGKLELVTVDSPLASFRPPDDLLLQATRLSGVPAFIELIDESGVDGMHDPLRGEIEKLIAG